MRDSNQITREYFDEILVEMRHIDAVTPDTAVTFFGEAFRTPIATAALSNMYNACEDGMTKVAGGRGAVGSPEVGREKRSERCAPPEPG